MSSGLSLLISNRGAGSLLLIVIKQKYLFAILFPCDIILTGVVDV